ncbi:putative phospholipid-transporting ATPase IA [Tritrichomonas foetus]|uniref:Phospholipid-transporting ATPase n=1 Tax=Tritrichomonas foetus TaxID=1144522 RepID=A0A1J4KUQ3_9EUKA|nr:putative phospholipid-transporting ATPase IA [Tritrichomonas foetus]|eukprot:OHT15009.1 putative phospholipid-transporting ATPase IA [Tritrichomonas foetus]
MQSSSSSSSLIETSLSSDDTTRTPKTDLSTNSSSNSSSSSSNVVNLDAKDASIGIDPWASIEIFGENKSYPGQKNNLVKTNRYNLITFLPLTLFENFRNLANIFFLTSVIISFLPYSPVSAIFVLVPLLFVLSVSIIKAGVEDLIKHHEDKKWNSQPCKVFRNKQWTTVTSDKLKVGDILMVEKDEMIPADLLYLTSSQDDNLAYYSETSLNGESAVKTMNCYSHFKGKDPIKEFSRHKYYLDVSEPDRDLTRYDMRLRRPQDHTFWAVSIKNVLLRGVMTHYTQNIVGIVIRTGHDTKIMKNMKHPPAKMTSFDRGLNRMIIALFIIFVILVTLSTGIALIIEKKTDFTLVLDTIPSVGQNFGEYFMQYFIIYSYFIPISMMVTIELIRLFFKILMSYDAEMFDPEFGHAIENNSNQIGQLGIVTHVLSDKTGTLTENLMELQKLSFNGNDYNAETFQLDFKDKAAMNFLKSMALCNNVIVHNSPSGKIEYNADSPDEAAFVDFAAKHNVRLIARDLNTMTVEIDGVKKVFNILAQLPFNSDRKRMSILIQEEGTNDQAILFTKGADNIMQNLTIDYNKTNLVNEYAISGLRTLVFAYKEMKDEELEQWLRTYHEAESSIEDRDKKVAEAAKEVECDLSVIGVTGVEDKLQEGVPDTIYWLRKADLKIWVLTGDKLETAVAIGRTTKVILPDSDVIIIGTESHEEVGHLLESAQREIDEMTNPVLIVSGNAVEMCLKDEYLKQFMDLADKSSAVILSRVSPFMKAQVTAAVKARKDCFTLAIGDGANDVGMIQISDVGVGVFGREGSQAAQAADFSLPRFRHLKRLMGVHGHWSYYRFSNVALFMLYKCFVFTFAQVWWTIYNLSTPQSYYIDFYLSLFNLIFTVLPPAIIGVTEQDLPQEVLLEHPELYKDPFDVMKFKDQVWYFILALYQSVVVFYGIILVMGDTESLKANGLFTYIAVCYTVVIQAILWTKYHNIFNWILYPFNLVLILLIAVVNLWTANIDYKHIVESSMSKGKCWFALIGTVIAALLPSIIADGIAKRFFPTKKRIYCERYYLQKKSGYVPDYEAEVEPDYTLNSLDL